MEKNCKINQESFGASVLSFSKESIDLKKSNLHDQQTFMDEYIEEEFFSDFEKTMQKERQLPLEFPQINLKLEGFDFIKLQLSTLENMSHELKFYLDEISEYLEEKSDL